MSDFYMPARPPNDEVRARAHSVVIRNVGRRKASNVKVRHSQLPDFDVSPRRSYVVEDLPNAGKQISFDSLVPGEQVTMNYLYFAPLMFNQIRTEVVSDDGYARVVNVLLVPLKPSWRIFGERVLGVTGAATLLYGVAEALLSAWRYLQ